MLNSIRNKALLIVLLLLGFSVTFFGTFILKENGHGGWLLYDYLSPNVLLMTVSAFLLFQMNKRMFKNSEHIVTFSNTSFGIYLLHPIVLQVLYYIIFDKINISAWIDIPLQTILTFLISFGIIWVIQRFKYSSYIVGV